MRLAICNEIFDTVSLDQGFAIAAELGYEGIEIAPATLFEDPGAVDVRSIVNKRRNEVRAAAHSVGLDVVGLHWLLAGTKGLHLTSDDGGVRRRTADYLAALARLTADLGGKLMVLGSPLQRNLLPGVDHAAAEQFALDVLQQCLPACEESDVTIALEPLGPSETDVLTSAGAVVRLLQKLGSRYCRLHLDAKAMCEEARPASEIIRDHHDWLVHFHANDPNRLGPGMGTLDFRPIIAALRDVEYSGWISVEPFEREPSSVEVAEQSIMYLKQVTEQP
jgi:sugar phosphate isomerase/epimerase